MEFLFNEWLNLLMDACYLCDLNHLLCWVYKCNMDLFYSFWCGTLLIRLQRPWHQLHKFYFSLFPFPWMIISLTFNYTQQFSSSWGHLYGFYFLTNWGLSFQSSPCLWVCNLCLSFHLVWLHKYTLVSFVFLIFKIFIRLWYLD